MTTDHKDGDNGDAEHTLQPKKQWQPLSHRDAQAASPEDYSVCGEEDPGSALESLVDYEK